MTDPNRRKLVVDEAKREIVKSARLAIEIVRLAESIEVADDIDVTLPPPPPPPPPSGGL